MATYPTVITVVSSVPQEQEFWGPYPYLGNRFIFGFNFVSGNITVAKSADLGVTWTECDAANARARGSAVVTFATCADADYPATPKIYVVFLQTATNLFRLATFDVSTETWDAGDIQSVLGYTAGPPSPGKDDNSWFIAHRATDNKVVMFVASGLEAVGPGNRWRCQYATCDLTGLAWSAYTQVGTAGGDNRNYFSNGCIAGDGGLTHFFFRKSGDVTVVNNRMSLQHVSLTSGGALSANQEMIPEQVANTEGFRRSSNPTSRLESGVLTLYVPVRFLNSDVTPKLYIQRLLKAASAVTPTWSDITIKTGEFPVTPGQPTITVAPLCVFDNNGVLVAMWGLNNFDGLGAVTSTEIRQSLSSDGVIWPADTLFYTGPAGTTIGGAFIGGRNTTGSIFGFAAEFGDGIADDILNYWEQCSRERSVSASPPA